MKLSLPRPLLSDVAAWTVALAVGGAPALSSTARADEAPAATGVVVTGATPAVVVEKPRIAVLGFEAASLDLQVREALEATIDTAVTDVAKTEVIGPGDVRALLNVSAYQQLLGCDDARCIRDAKNLLNVQRIVSGTVNRVGTKYVVDLRLIDLVNATTLKKVTFESDGDVEKLVREATKAVPALFGFIGHIEIWNQPTEAEAFLDARPLGKTPIGRVDVREPGQHVLSIVGPGVTPWKETVNVAPGTALRVRAQNERLTDVEIASTLWNVTGGGLVALGAIAGAASGTLYYLAWRSDQRLDRIDLRTAKQSDVDGITQDTFTNLAGSVTAGVVGGVALLTGVAALVINPPRGQLDAALHDEP